MAMVDECVCFFVFGCLVALELICLYYHNNTFFFHLLMFQVQDDNNKHGDQNTKDTSRT
jgi:hypothetical protein